MPLIDRDALVRDHGFFIEDEDGFPTCVVCETDIRHYPTIDAVPVVHGVWERSIDNDCLMHKCSVCGARVVKGLYEYENPNLYCYHCGAKMDGERRSDD